MIDQLKKLWILIFAGIAPKKEAKIILRYALRDLYYYKSII